ncbi:LPXTG cell wall anchor domain-containing protein [Microbacterium sp. 2C]|uniref:SpaA isopeptide-forming pilin-related protein n=1 Tax=Microbacterium paulum TaxID=2707006 RepID=UPI0018C343E1|nr:LPXTG cell wall anchor domain-containing protein [Microbacterium paulum]
MTYTPPYLTLSKTVVNGATGASGSAAQFTLNAAATGLSSVSVPGTNTAKKAVAVGSYALTESTTLAGYDWTNLVCTGSSGNPSVTMSPASPPYTSASVPIAKGAALTCSLTNTARTTTLTWDKTDVDTGQLIGGSTWTLVGPSGGASSTITVADDTGQAGYTGRDTNPAAGRFTVTGLPWGTYTLTETQAPTGYTVTGSALTVVLGGATTTVNAGTITNTRTLTFGVGKYRYAASGLGPLLDGGAFSVLADNAGQPGTVVPGAAVTPTGSTGMFTMTGLRPGTYWLAETKAPAGHQLLAQPIKFAVVYNATNTTPKLQLVGTNQRLASLSADAQTLRVSDVPTLILPLSGGSGWALPAAIGVVLLLAVIGWAGWRRRRTDDASDSASRLHASPRTPREDDHENH